MSVSASGQLILFTEETLYDSDATIVHEDDADLEAPTPEPGATEHGKLVARVDRWWAWAHTVRDRLRKHRERYVKHHTYLRRLKSAIRLEDERIEALEGLLASCDELHGRTERVEKNAAALGTHYYALQNNVVMMDRARVEDSTQVLQRIEALTKMCECVANLERANRQEIHALGKENVGLRRDLLVVVKDVKDLWMDTKSISKDIRSILKRTDTPTSNATSPSPA
jgi:hypothetical protein